MEGRKEGRRVLEEEEIEGGRGRGTKGRSTHGICLITMNFKNDRILMKIF